MNPKSSHQEAGMNFRKIVAIIRTDSLENVEAALKAKHVPGVSVTKVKGYGEYANFFTRSFYRRGAGGRYRRRDHGSGAYRPGR